MIDEQVFKGKNFSTKPEENSTNTVDLKTVILPR